MYQELENPLINHHTDIVSILSIPFPSTIRNANVLLLSNIQSRTVEAFIIVRR